MPSYEYRNVKIDFNERKAEFEATINNQRIAAPSLTKVKAKIDKTFLVEFKPFTALRYVKYDDKNLEVVNVIGIRKERRRGRTINHFVIKEGGGEYGLMEDSQKNRKAIEARDKRKSEVEAIKDKLGEELNALSEAIKHINPNAPVSE